MPQQMEKVFSGVIYDIYQWEQELYDGSLAIFEKAKRKYSTVVIALVGDKIVLTKQEQPSKPSFLGLIGGRMDVEGEIPLANAKRELLEEAGMRSDNIVLVGTFVNEYQMDYKCYVFVAHDCQKVQEVELDAGERIEIELITQEKFFELLSADILQESRVLKTLFKNELSNECKERIQGFLQ